MKEKGKRRYELKDKGMVRSGRSVCGFLKLYTTGWSALETGGRSQGSVWFIRRCVVVCR